MANVAVVYWSGTGNTEAMANLVVEGVKVAGGNAELLVANDFESGMVSEYDAIAFGCPSMGDEILEEDEFEPMFTDVESSLTGKKVGLFGSYGWGDGLWMRNWEERCMSGGMKLVGSGVIANEVPNEEDAENCRNLGKTLAS